MSDISMPKDFFKDFNFEATECYSCGTKLNKEALDADRDICQDCYSDKQD